MAVAKLNYMDTAADNSTLNSDNADWCAQAFTASDNYRINYVILKVGKVGAGDVDITVSIQTIVAGVPDGVDLCSGTIAAAVCEPAYTQKATMDTYVQLTKGTQYAIVMRSADVGGAEDWRCYFKDADEYTDNNYYTSDNSGVTWTPDATKDANFQVWGVASVPADRYVDKFLVVIADNSLSYEDTAGSLTELAASDQDLDCSEQVAVFEAFQKVIVVNGANLKVADFINTRIDLGVGNELTSPPAKGDVLTQTTSGAKMIVDFVDSTKRYIYGYTTTATVFTVTAGHTLVSGDEKATMDPNPAPKPDVVSEATTTPLWYDYTTYPNIILSVERYGQDIGATKTFGVLPEHGVFPAKAYLGCLYRGRVVLAGNPSYPHQWYMSRQADIWDFAYLANDGQSPVVGNNAEAGEIGDIITCLIPYKDDYLIFGGASTIYVLRGDPAKGGELDPVDLTVGIYGATSWCFDGDGNLYFWGTNGIYVMPAGFGAVKCLTENTIPNIIADENINPSTHRITLGYDRKRRGVLVCITVLATGVNSNYWYDLRTGGFFPESYPAVCGAYGMFYYAANNKDYADLLLACKDGYVRKFLDTAKGDDDGVGADTAINSYCALPIQPLAPDGDHEGKLTSLTITNAGGAAGGTELDTDGLDYKLYVADDAETCLEKMKATVAWATGTVYAVGDLTVHGTLESRCIVGHTSDVGGPPNEAPDTNTTDWETVAQESGTLSGTGRKERLRHRVRGAYLGLKIGNSTADETFAVEAIAGEVQPAGKLK